MIFTDGDNFAGVDFDDEGEDEHLNGIDPWIDREELYNQFPSLKSKAFAVTESVSSMSPEKNHRRYRIAFLFDEPITSREDFGKLLTALATEFRVIDPTDRAPSQPVFGNAREETRDNAEIFGNVLSLKDYLSDTEPEPPAAAAAAPTPTATPPSKKKPSVDISLDEFIKQNGIATLGSRPNGGHYVECPNRSNHTDEKNGKTDAYIWENEDGTYAFYCSHAHCVDKRTWAYFRDRVAPKRKRSESPPPLNTQQKKAPTLDEVLDNIKAYEKAPETATLNDVCEAISTLDSLIEKEAAIKELSKLKNAHGLSLTKLREAVKEVEAQANAETSDSFFNDGKFLPGAVCDALEDEQHFLTLPIDNELRVYQSGVYVEDTTSETAKTVDAWLGSATRPERINNALDLLKIRTKSDADRHTDYINLMNGRLCLNSWQLLDHTPQPPSLIQLPVRYDEDATSKEFDEWLSDVLPAQDDQQVLLQLLGYSMLQDVRFEKIAVLYGPTHTGKGTCLRILKALVGEDNTSAISLHALDNEERRFTRSGLVGKLANLSADLSSRYLAGDSQIKQIASGDPMQVEFKGQKSFIYKPFATLWASCNQLPVSHDRTDAWYERLILLGFFEQHTGKNADRTLLQRLTQPKSLSGILNRAIAALRELIENNAFIATESTNALLEQYRLENDHVDRFLSENYVRAKGVESREDSVYGIYAEWCESEGIKALSKAKFRAGVASWGCPRKRKGSTQRYFVFDGLEIQ